MSYITSRAGMLAVALAGLLAGQPRATACLPPGEQLSFKSAYSATPIVPGARQVFVRLSLDAAGDGSGVVVFNPNIIDEFGSTCIAIKDVPVRARLIVEEGAAAKGRRVYELKPTGDEGKVEQGQEHWLLIRPLKAGVPSTLVFVDKDGKFRDVVVVE